MSSDRQRLVSELRALSLHAYAPDTAFLPHLRPGTTALSRRVGAPDVRRSDVVGVLLRFGYDRVDAYAEIEEYAHRPPRRLPAVHVHTVGCGRDPQLSHLLIEPGRTTEAARATPSRADAGAAKLTARVGVNGQG